jgi:hypothetical protein
MASAISTVIQDGCFVIRLRGARAAEAVVASPSEVDPSFPEAGAPFFSVGFVEEPKIHRSPREVLSDWVEAIAAYASDETAEIRHG